MKCCLSYEYKVFGSNVLSLHVNPWEVCLLLQTGGGYCHINWAVRAQG